MWRIADFRQASLRQGIYAQSQSFCAQILDYDSLVTLKSDNKSANHSQGPTGVQSQPIERAFAHSERHGDWQLDTTAQISDLAENRRHDQFIPVRKEDLFSVLIKQGDLADPAERELFWRFARTLRTICHYEYSETLDRLRRFTPISGHR